jgi:ABC-type proline/glycine betaine transport system ATPase subunit
MTQRINGLVEEHTAHFPLSLAFLDPARRHGIQLKFDQLHSRSVACISDHVLLLVDGDEDEAEKLLNAVDIMPLVTVIAENFVSHLVTREMRIKPIWVEEDIDANL